MTEYIGFSRVLFPLGAGRAGIQPAHWKEALA